MPTTNREMPMLRGEESYRNGVLTWKRPSTIETRYTSAMAPVAPTTIERNVWVTRIRPARKAINNTANTPKVSATAWMAIPGKRRSNMAEMPPIASPSRAAYGNAR